MFIAKYINANNILVQFKDQNQVVIKTKYCHFSKGAVGNPFDKTVCNNGYLGLGVFKSHNVNNVVTLEYDEWRHMLERCYNTKIQNKYPTYIGCTVCEEWHNFQNFAKWWRNNYYNVEGYRTELDKDILIKNNKYYSPETCCVVPSNINALFTKGNKQRGKYPIGVSYYKSTGKFVAHCCNGKRQIHLSYCNTPNEAFAIYKEYKEKTIKKIADKYKKGIPSKLYNALIRYQVEITD